MRENPSDGGLASGFQGLEMGWHGDCKEPAQGNFGDDGIVLYPDCGGGHVNLYMLKLIKLYTPNRKFYYTIIKN